MKATIIHNVYLTHKNGLNTVLGLLLKNKNIFFDNGIELCSVTPDDEGVRNFTSKKKGYKQYIKGKRLLNYILCIRFFIEVHSIVSASRFFHMPTYLRVVIECQSRFFPFFPAFSRNCPDYFLHTSGSSSFRSLSDLGAR